MSLRHENQNVREGPVHKRKRKRKKEKQKKEKKKKKRKKKEIMCNEMN